MARLILTTDYVHSRSDESETSDLFLNFGHCFGLHLQRLVYGPPPTVGELEDRFDVRSEHHQERGSHWLDFNVSERLDRFEVRGIGLAQLCACFETVELWIGPTANDQLELIWLLDYLRRRNAITKRLFLRLAEPLIGRSTEEFAAMDAPRIPMTSTLIELASKAWQAFRAPTPQAWCNLLQENLGPLPNLRETVLRLLIELPAPGTGLGSTEMGLLELIYPDPPHRLSVILNTLVYFNGYYRHTVFSYNEAALLAEPLAFGPAPAIVELDPELKTLDLRNMRQRHEIHRESRPRLSDFGEAVLLGRDDFTRCNPIRRYWCSTELTNDNLWRWDPIARELMMP